MTNAIPSGIDDTHHTRVSGYPGEDPVLTYSLVVPGLFAFGFNGGGQGFVTISNITTDGGSGWYISGPYSEESYVPGNECHHIVFDGNRVLRTLTGMGFQATNAMFCTWRNNYIYDVGSYVNGPGWPPDENDLHVGRNHAIYLSDRTKDCIIENNHMELGRAYAVHIYGNADTILRHTVRNNRIHGFGGSGANGAAIIAYGIDHLIYNNLCYDNWYEGIVLRGCLRAMVWFNTVYGNGTHGSVPGIIMESGTNCEARNNISWGNANDTVTGFTASSNNLTSNPSFVNAGAQNFHLQPGSAAIATGVNIAGVTADFDAVTRPGVPSRGAYEP
jgi:hypothetical protein